MREVAPRSPPPPANDNAGDGGPRRAPGAAVRHDTAPLGAVWVDAEIVDDATMIEPDGGDPLFVLVPRI